MIEISHLSKRFGALQAIDDLCLTLAPGEILGFLGPNGAGKSTTMKMLTGFLAPDAGEVSVFGQRLSEDPLGIKAAIGYLPEGAPAYDDMRVSDFLNFIAAIRGFEGADRAARVEAVMATLSLTGVADQRIETLSKGFKRRVGLAQAIIHDPRVLILDEPTDGLDPNQKHQVRNLIRGLSTDKIVIISTHILEEVTAVCTRAVILANGKLLMDCTPEELEQRSRHHGAVTVTFDTSETTAQALEAFKTLPAVSSVEMNGNRLTLFPAAPAGLYDSVSEQLRGGQFEAVSVYQERGRLDDVFRDITLGGAQ